MLWKRSFVSALVLYLLLGSWKGYLALFEKGKIPIRNDRDLQQALEDYLS